MSRSEKIARIVCAMPQAAFRSILLTFAVKTPSRAAILMQIAGNRASAKPLTNQPTRQGLGIKSNSNKVPRIVGQNIGKVIRTFDLRWKLSKEMHFAEIKLGAKLDTDDASVCM